MATLNFQAQSKRGELIIRACYQTISQNRKFLNTGFKVPATKVRGVYKYWDIAKQRPKPDAENFDALNEYLQCQESKFHEYLKECRSRDKAPQIDDLTNLLRDRGMEVKTPKTIQSTVCEPELVIEKTAFTKNIIFDKILVKDLTPALKLYVRFAIEKSSDVKKTTFRPYKTFGQQLRNFEMQRTAGPINLNAIDVKFYKEFTTWLIGKQNNVNSTINRKVKRLKTFLNWALEEGFINVATYKKKYKLNEVEASKFPLYKEEKELFYKYIPKAGTESNIYWAFRFAFCTGLRYSDICRVKSANIKYIEDSGRKLYYLDVVEQKTSERTSVPLTSMAIDILSKAKPDAEGQLFQIPTDQECNRTLKEIGNAIGLDRICELKQFQGRETVTEYLPLKDILSFHFARYTYITDLLNSGLAPVHVQYNVGHNKLDTTLEYNRDIDKDRILSTLLVQERIA